MRRVYYILHKQDEVNFDCIDRVLAPDGWWDRLKWFIYHKYIKRDFINMEKYKSNEPWKIVKMDDLRKYKK